MNLRVEFRGKYRSEVVVRVDANHWVATKNRMGRWMIEDRIKWSGQQDSRGARGFATLEDLLTAIEESLGGTK
jgi:hypothetical protein